MRTILGLDLGTNSIGWALIEQNFENKKGKILGMGSRIIPMSQDILGEFGKGNSVSQTAERTGYRGVRRLRERYLLRRERLHRVLNVLGFLPKHYAAGIDFEKRLGQFKAEAEPKLVYNTKEFIFKKSFEEMLADFRQYQPQILVNEKGEEKLVPCDWTIYFLRKKALSQKIEKEELAWILLKFNQKRGYYQLRGEEDEDATRTAQTRIYFDTKVIDEIIDTGAVYKGLKVIQIKLANGDTGKYFSKELPNWIGQEKNIIATIDLDKEGNDKYEEDGTLKRRFSIPTEEDWDKKWKLVKIKTEKEIKDSNKTVGAYIYDTLLQTPKQKIKGKLVRTIERKFYKEELKAILKKQIELQPELFSEDLYNDCVRELYRNNDAHQLQLSRKDFVHLFLDDIIFYQRPLRSQKSSIGNCALEYRIYKDENGVKQTQYLKAIPKSNPYYQEFRIWQWMYNLKIYKKEDDSDVTVGFLNSFENFENLFEFLNNRKEVEQKALLKYLLEQKEFKGKLLNAEVEKYRWNYVEDKKYPCNETKTLIGTRLEKVENISNYFLTRPIEQQLWHLIYSVTDKVDYEKALKSFAAKHQLDEASFVTAFIKFPPFKSEYGSYSEKSIKKLLPLLRIGKYWSWDAIDEKSKARIEKILNGEYDENIKDRVREKLVHLTQENHFQGLQLWLAQYIVYDATIAGKWNSVKDLEKYLEDFKQHSLCNPIVEQVITETLRVVKDIWIKYGNGAKDFFSEIHVELGREMKNTADDRKSLTNQITENENTNLRIKALLAELMEDANVENVRPYSPTQQELLKIFEEGVLNSDIEIEDDILKISKTAQPSSSDLKRYKLWLEQKYRSPYTGAVILLNKLFTPEYEIEHIIPQSRYFDDSFSNKIICEAAVNKLKGNQIGLAFIKNHHGETVQLGSYNNGIFNPTKNAVKTAKVFEVAAYEDFVKQHYTKNRSKRNKLLMEEIPEKMIEWQINDTRHISKYISNLLSNIVRADANDDGVNSKNIIPGNGKITTELKQDWGLNDVWNALILPRFERMNQISNSSDFTAWNESHNKFLPTVPLELSKGFSKKRIDHRHHAMDALVVACATREHVNYMNNEHALRKGKSKEEKQSLRYDLRSNLCDKKYNEGSDKNYKWVFKKPWEGFTQDARNALENIVVSFKQNLRVINKATNSYEKIVEKDGLKIKQQVKQEGTNWAIRKPMHKETVSGLIQLRKKKMVSLNLALDTVSDIVDKEFRKEVQSLVKSGLDKKKISKHFKDADNKWNGQDISKVEIYYWEKDNVASRVSLNDTFDEKRIGSITDTGIQRILLNHLGNYKDRKDEKGKAIAASLLAFSPEGIEEMNKNITALNNGKPHQAILKVRTYEPKGNKFHVGQTGNKKDKYVEAAKGTNLFFAVYWDEEKQKRNYETIPLNEVIEHQKWRATLPREEQDKTPLIPVKTENGTFLFSLSPNDLVYVPTDEEKENTAAIDFSDLKNHQIDNIYKVVSFTGNQIFFIRHNVATSIVNKVEFSSLNKTERTIDGLMAKEACIKLKADRLGNISKA